ncbi:hypothetical protein Y032_0338g2937 [Ancylostoma ceylanicum]|uniref:Uncharacterized protein n=1 Tax=Ancylostoma ceylanicum TaxID=53326 RepID=A0A016RY68_9BILA|nr:hypothetical protein Y032_0338g2937 [Ancylostoma ceylanicum]
MLAHRPSGPRWQLCKRELPPLYDYSWRSDWISTFKPCRISANSHQIPNLITKAAACADATIGRNVRPRRSATLRRNQ